MLLNGFRDREKELPLVSICIPAYNTAHVIRETLESALRQDYPNLEIIVSDDGSTDRTPEIVQEYESQGVKLIRQEQNLGRALNMNAVIRPSGGKYVCKLDSDDVLEPEYISSMVEVMEAYPRITFAHCACRLMDVDGKFLGYEKSIQGSFIRNGLEEWRRYVFGPRAISIIMFRRSAFDAVGGFDERLNTSCHDWKIHCDLLKIGDVFYNDKVLATYRMRPPGSKRLLFRAQAHLFMLKYLGEQWPEGVPNKEKLLSKGYRHMALGLVFSAAFAESADAKEMLKFLPEYGNYLPARLLSCVIRFGGSGIIRGYCRQKMQLRQAVKKLLYKNPDSAGQTAIVSGAERNSSC